MIFELPDIFFGSHKKRKGITTTAGETVRIYKKGRKSLTTSGFFKKSGDIFFGATSQTKQSTVLSDGAFVFVREGMNAQRQGYEPEGRITRRVRR